MAIKERVEKRLEEADDGNQQYLPDLVEKFIGISYLLPVWTAIMVSYFCYGNATATTATVKRNFNDLKYYGLSWPSD